MGLQFAGAGRGPAAVPAELALITDERLDRYLAQARATARALEVLLLAPAERRGFGEGP
ncbi:hypothetical protein [Streptomyces cinereoruber]|uniref:hypothetical protein n=1 Tax=Streptomyces cinereoruber TaxID=67260 RepID=UPI003C3031AB